MKKGLLLIIRAILVISVVMSVSSSACEMIMGYRVSERAPFIGKSPSNAGLYQDLYTMALADIGCQLKIIRAPKNRLLAMLKHGEIDFYPTLGKSSLRNEYLYFFPTGLKTKPVILTRSDVADITAVEALAGKVMVKARGTNNMLTEQHKYIRNVEDLSISQAIAAIESNKADFFQYDQYSIAYYLKQNPNHNVKVHDGLYQQGDAHLGFAKRSVHAKKYSRQAANMNKFAKALNVIATDGRLERLLQQYF